MPARVTGDKRRLADRPGKLAPDSLDRLRKDMEDDRKMDENKKNPTKPKPTCDIPAGYEKGMIWEDDKWCTWEDWEESMQCNGQTVNEC